MAVLKDRCLISILNGTIMMHDLIQEMGQEIVHQECRHNPGKRSRLWKAEEICRVLEKNKGTDAVQCIFLSRRENNKVQIHSEVFEKMENLRMLDFQCVDIYRQSRVIIPSSLESLPDGLKILHWDGFPQRSLRPNFLPENLVTLEMRNSHLEQLDQAFPKLKRLDLRYSRELIRIPDLYLSPDIEVIFLNCCTRLTEVYSSGFLNKLKCLDLQLCDELRSLTIPSNILSRSSGLINLRYCEKLETFSIPNRSKGWDNGTASDSKGILSRVKGTFDPVLNIDRHEKEYECSLNLSGCESFTSLSFEFDLSKLKFLNRLHLNGCSNLDIFPEIEDTMENLAELNLEGTAIRALPSSLCRLVALQELKLRFCRKLQTIPNSIFKLKLTNLDLSGCSKLRTFPEILEPAQTFAHVNLTDTAIKELPSSFGNLVQLQTLCLKRCRDLESLPNSIVNLNLLSVLNCSGCAKLTRIPRLPPFLKELLAFDCHSITSVMSNSLIQIPTNSKEGVIFKFYFTNGQQLDPGAHANIVDDARRRMTGDAYRSVLFCFPGSEVPHWFPFRGKGDSITINTGSLNFYSDDRLIGFALFAVLQLLDTDNGRVNSFTYCLKYESDDGEHFLPKDDEFDGCMYWKRKFDQDHTLLWKYNLEIPGMSSKSHMLPRARSFTFEIGAFHYYYFKRSSFLSTVKVKECGICPLYTKEKDDNNAGAGNYSGSVRFSNNDIEEPSGSDVAWMEEGL